MADTRVKIVDLQVNVQQAVEAMAQYNQRIDEAREKQKQLKNELKNGTISQQQYQKAMAYSRISVRANQDAVNTLNKQVQNQIRYNREQVGSLNQLKAQLQAATTQYNALSQAERNSEKGDKLRAQISNLKTEIKGASASVTEFYSKVGRPNTALAGINSLTAKFKQFAVMTGSMVLGGGLMAFSKQVVTTTRNFEDGMAHVQSIVNGSKKDFDSLRDKAIELGEKYRYTAIQAAQSEEMLARNGLNAKETVAAVGQTLQFAQANAIDLADAADIMTNTLNASGLRKAAKTQEELAYNLQRVSDVMSRTAATSATNVTDLGEAMVNALPIAKTLGATIEDTSAQLATLADNGVKGAYAGTQMRMILNGLANQTKAQKQTLAQLGVTINESTIRADGLTGTFEKLRDAGVLKLSNRMQVLGNIFGKRVAPAAIQLIENVDRTKKHLDDLNGAMDETNAKGQKVGTTARMFGQSYSSMGVAIDALKSAWEHFQIMLGDSQMGGLTNVVGTLHDAVIWVADNIPTVVNIVKAAIAGITFTKLAASAKASFMSMRSSAVANAESATRAVNASKESELRLDSIIQQKQALLDKERASSSVTNANKIKLVESQLASYKQQKSIQTAQTQKLQAEEVTQWNRAQALTTGNVWKAGFAAAGIAARSFVLTCKSVFKGFIVTALISLAFEALMKLYDAFNSGQGILGRFGTWVKTKVGASFQIVLGVIKSFIGVLQALDKKFAVTGKVAAVFGIQFAVIGGIIKSVWSIIKWWAKNVTTAFNGVGAVAYRVGTIIKDVFTFQWGNIGGDFRNLMGTVAGVGKSFTMNAKSFASEIKKNVTQAVTDIKEASSRASKSYIQSTPTRRSSGGSGSTSLGKRAPAPTPQEEPITLPEAGGAGGGKSGSKSSSKSNASALQREQEKEQKDREKASEKEQKALDEAEKAELDLLRDTMEKRRMALEQQYDSEIRQLRSRLENERNLTEKARDAINRTIIAKEEKKQQELAKLSDEEVKNEIARQEKLNEARLAVLKKGSEDEIRLQTQNIELKRVQDQRNLDDEEDNAAENSRMKVQNAQNEVNSANQIVSNLQNEGKGAGNEDYDAAVKAAEEANKKLADAEAERLATKQYYDNMRATIDEKARQDTLKAEEEFQQTLNDIRIKAMEDQLAQTKLNYSALQDSAHADYEAFVEIHESKAGFAQTFREKESNESEQEYQQSLDAAYQSYQEQLANDQQYQDEKAQLKQDADNADLEREKEVQDEQAAIQQLGLDVTTQNQLDQLQQQQDIDEQKYNNILSQGQLENETREEYDARVTEAKAATEKDREAINSAETKNEQAKLTALRSVGSGIIDLLNAVGDENSAAAKIAKVITLAQIAIDTGKALAAGIASASSLPYPANLAAIATTVATILANVATAISTVKSAHFAQGGKVNGGGSDTSDSVPAMLSNGEYVMTAKATRLFEPLLAAMNGIGAGVPIQANNSYREVQNTDAMTEGFAQAVKEMPQPVVSVQEITDTQERVKTIQNLDNI